MRNAKAESEYLQDMIANEIEYQKLNEVLGKPVDLAKVWDCFDQLMIDTADAIEEAADERDWAVEKMEEAEEERKEAEERADKAEKDWCELSDESAALKERIEELERELSKYTNSEDE